MASEDTRPAIKLDLLTTVHQLASLTEGCPAELNSSLYLVRHGAAVHDLAPQMLIRRHNHQARTGHIFQQNGEARLLLSEDLVPDETRAPCGARTADVLPGPILGRNPCE